MSIVVNAIGFEFECTEMYYSLIYGLRRRYILCQKNQIGSELIIRLYEGVTRILFSIKLYYFFS